MDGIFKKHLFLHPLTQSLTHLSYLEDVYCLLIDGLLTFYKSIIFISAATFYVGAYQITPKHLHCFTSVNDLQTLLVSDYAQVSGLQKSRRQIQRQRPVSAAILA